jgi:hypothetical protein
VQDLEVPADRHVGHTQIPDQVRDPDRAVSANAVEDERLSLAGEHQRTGPESCAAARVTGTSLICRTECRGTDRKSTRINKSGRNRV